MTQSVFYLKILYLLSGFFTCYCKKLSYFTEIFMVFTPSEALTVSTYTPL